MVVVMLEHNPHTSESEVGRPVVERQSHLEVVDNNNNNPAFRAIWELEPEVRLAVVEPNRPTSRWAEHQDVEEEEVLLHQPSHRRPALVPTSLRQPLARLQ